MKYINKITGNPSQIFPSVQYKGEFDVSIYIGTPDGELKEIELDAAKNRMIINVNNEEDGTLIDTSLYAGNSGNAWYANIVSIPAADATEIKFSPYMKVTTARNAFRNFASLEKISGLNFHNANDLYSTFSNYRYATNVLYDIRTVDGGGHQGSDIYKDGDTCQVIIKNEYSAGAVNCEYMFSQATRITDVSLSVAKPGSCRSTFENAPRLTNVELNLGSLTNGGTNRVDGMFNGAANLVSVTGYIEGHNLARVNNMFASCENLETFCGITHLGETFTYQSQYKNNQQLDLSMATNLDEQSVHDVVNKLGQIPAAENIDYAWVKFAPGKLQYLTAAEIAAAEAKGWQILELEQ